jgi:alpha-mannosidase
LKSDINFLENRYLRIEFESHSGYIKRFYNRINDIEVLSSFGAVPVVMDEHECDTWAHGFSKFENEIGKFTDARFSLLEQGPLRARLRITSRYNNSELQQDFLIYHDRPDIEVRVKLDWREKHKLLKLSFPVKAVNPRATYEIPYGFIERPVNGEEEPGQQWFDVSDENYGLAIINDAKYSYDVQHNDMRLTLVRSPIYADHFGERDEYCEFMDQGIQEFNYLLVPHKGDWKKSDIAKKAYELNVPATSVIETYHKGTMPLKFEAISISADNVIATVFKRAEDEDGYILRCYETEGMETTTQLELPLLNRNWKADFGKCEIKTFWIPDSKDLCVQEKNLLEV